MLENKVSEDELILTPTPEDELILTPTPEDELILTPTLEDELILTPTLEDEKPESAELILEADLPDEPSEITFDDEEESADRIRKAMEDYDAAMDQAAGLKK